MPVIKDGGTGNTARVNAANQLLVRAIVEPEIEDASEGGQAYTWTSGDLDIDAGDTMLLVKNTSDTNFHVTTIVLSGGNVATRYLVHFPSTDVTVAGTTVVGVNLNTGSANVAEATAASDETGNVFAQANVINDVSLLATTSFTLHTEGILLAKNKSIAVDQVAESTAGSVTIVGHYEQAE